MGVEVSHSCIVEHGTLLVWQIRHILMQVAASFYINEGASHCSWCSQDPFDTSHDLGRTVDRQTCTFLRGEFERAARLLHEHAHTFQQLFEPSPTHNSK